MDDGLQIPNGHGESIGIAVRIVADVVGAGPSRAGSSAPRIQPNGVSATLVCPLSAHQHPTLIILAIP
jgi:hypothetical protein